MKEGMDLLAESEGKALKERPKQSQEIEASLEVPEPKPKLPEVSPKASQGAKPFSASYDKYKSYDSNDLEVERSEIHKRLEAIQAKKASMDYDSLSKGQKRKLTTEENQLTEESTAIEQAYMERDGFRVMHKAVRGVVGIATGEPEVWGLSDKEADKLAVEYAKHFPAIPVPWYVAILTVHAEIDGPRIKETAYRKGIKKNWWNPLAWFRKKEGVYHDKGEE